MSAHSPKNRTSALKPAPVFISLILLITSSPFVTTAQAQTSTSRTRSSSPLQIAQVLPETAYTLGSGDRLRIDVFNVPEYSGEYQVLVDGTLNLPVIGSLRVAGLTIAQATEIVSQRYAPFLRRPIVTVGLLSPRPLKIAVAGEVSRPGAYTMEIAGGQQFPTVTQALERAGGITRSAAVRQVQLRRVTQGRQQTINLDLWALLQNADISQDITLRDGDTLFIPRSNTIDPLETNQLADASFAPSVTQPIDVAIVGEVNRPGVYTISPGGGGGSEQTGVRNAGARVTGAIGTAGGITPIADVRRVEIRRNTRDGSGQILEVDLWQLLQAGDLRQDPILQQGDTIFIPTATALDPSQITDLAAASFSPEVIRVNVVGEVNNPGTVQVPPNTPLNQVVLAAGGFDDRRARTASVELVRLNPNGTVDKRDVAINFEQGINEEGNPPLRNGDVVIVNRSGLARTSDTIGTILSPLGGVFSLFNFFRIFR